MASFLVCSVSVRASDNGLSTSDFMISICLLAPKYHVEALSHLCSLARSPNAFSSLARMEMIAYSSREFLISHPPRRQGFLRARKRKRERGREGRFCISRAICSQCTSTAASCLSLSSRAWPIPSIRPQFRFCWAFHSISIQSGGSEVSFRDEIDAVGSVALKLHAGVARALGRMQRADGAFYFAAPSRMLCM